MQGQPGTMIRRHSRCSLCSGYGASRAIPDVSDRSRLARQNLPFRPMRNPSFPALTVASAPNSSPGFLLDVLSGLGSPKKAIPPRWFYDQEGSKLFEDITRLPQYYPTRCERHILSTYIREIVPLLGH